MGTEEQARDLLCKIPYPGLERDIVSLGLVRSVEAGDDGVRITLALASPRPDVLEKLRSRIHDRLAAAGLNPVHVEVASIGPSASTSDPWARRGRLRGAGRIIAVGAGKGGVGKSTVAVNLALGLRDSGWKVGVLDADIYGPSVPTMLGLEDGARQVRLTDDRKILPLEAHNVSVVSFGFFLGSGAPVVWRGPLVGKAVQQFSRGVVWPELDVLVVDLPPGTGDVPLSLAQSVVVDGALVVTTPQRIAVLEAEKAAEMYGKLNVPLLGLVENMSHADCTCGRRSHPFGRGGADELAARLGRPVLGRIPFDEAEVEGGDRGRPALVSGPDGAAAEAFRTLAAGVRAHLEATVPEGAAS